MKLSEMEADQLCDVLCRLATPVCILLEDEHVQAMVQSLLQAGLAHTTPAHAWSMLITNLVPVLLQEHREETFLIASALLGRPVQQLRAEHGLTLLSELCACWDEELSGFFACAAGMAGTPC